jgi:hypothetical protein
MDIIEEYKEWSEVHLDPDYRCDEIFDFLERFDRSEIFGLMEWCRLMAEKGKD